ncbi:MAG TPA: glycosyltransferase [Cellulomonas sp.]
MGGPTARNRTTTFEHLARLTTPSGLFEHALGTAPRPGNGMCVDDVARALVVTARTPDPAPDVMVMTATYLRFVLSAQRAGGLMHNRRTADGAWVDAPTSDDHWGRALWALSTAAVNLPDARLAADARRGASAAMAARSVHPRAMAYAALGAAQLHRTFPEDEAALRLLRDARTVLPRPRSEPVWPWPEARLTYGNAVLPEAMITVGAELGDHGLLHDGLSLLRWLVDEQTVDGHLSLVPAGGRAPGDARPGFDQQPIEAAALAEAAATAFTATGDGRWFAVLDLCMRWFEGDNDGRRPMRDAATGGGFDGLEAGGVNQNQGAESTLAWLACRQLARVVPVTPAVMPVMPVMLAMPAMPVTLAMPVVAAR